MKTKRSIAIAAVPLAVLAALAHAMAFPSDSPLLDRALDGTRSAARLGPSGERVAAVYTLRFSGRLYSNGPGRYRTVLSGPSVVVLGSGVKVRCLRLTIETPASGSAVTVHLGRPQR